MSTRKAQPEQAIWWTEIGGQSNFWMRQKAFWLRSAAHYRDPYWRDVKGEMKALRQIREANKNIRRYCITL